MSSKSQNTRNQILQAAWKLLEADRGKGVRIADIAKQAGVSRQAVYLHFTKRADLLIETTHFIDHHKDLEGRLRPSRNAATGIERLALFVDAWCHYIVEIYPVAKALLAMSATDSDAAAAWDNRMKAMKHGCEAVINDLKRDKNLSSQMSAKESVDLFWTLLSVRNWEHLTLDCGWIQSKYVAHIKQLSRQLLIAKI
ncbi:MAG: TetR/AcrR family transcriptional regulator [Kangiellaceae bacterium]|nr:TetR/AcrR family transcriptional regulator [Kangiellaceae bacterium]